MTPDRAFEILSLQLCTAQMDTKKSWQKNNFIEALKVALDVLNEKIENGREKINDRTGRTA